jgi:hypothetical protein
VEAVARVAARRVVLALAGRTGEQEAHHLIELYGQGVLGNPGQNKVWRTPVTEKFVFVYVALTCGELGRGNTTFPNLVA